MQRFQNKVTLVTGSGDGIGRLTALEFAREGATVIVSDRNTGTGLATLADVRSAGSAKAEFIPADVSKEAEVKSLFAEIRKNYGRLDIAVNNAGVEGAVLPLEEQSNRNFEQVIGTNVWGTFLCMREELTLMKPQGAGVIVNLASITAHLGFAGLSIYTASKAAILAMTKSAALETARAGIRIASVSPGIVETAMLSRFFGGSNEARQSMTESMPLGRVCAPSEIARGVLFLASEDASLLVGQTLHLDGGWAFVKS